MWGTEHNVFYNYIDNQGLKIIVSAKSTSIGLVHI